MIDVIFLLLLFFVMVTSFEASAKVAVEVPHPEKSMATRHDARNELVIHCEYRRTQEPPFSEVLYRLGADQPQPLSAIAGRLEAARLANPQSSILIRADRRLPNGKVRDLVRVVAESGFEKISVGAKQDMER